MMGRITKIRTREIKFSMRIFKLFGCLLCVLDEVGNFNAKEAPYKERFHNTISILFVPCYKDKF